MSNSVQSHIGTRLRVAGLSPRGFPDCSGGCARGSALRADARFVALEVVPADEALIPLTPFPPSHGPEVVRDTRADEENRYEKPERACQGHPPPTGRRAARPVAKHTEVAQWNASAAFEDASSGKMGICQVNVPFRNDGLAPVFLSDKALPTHVGPQGGHADTRQRRAGGEQCQDDEPMNHGTPSDVRRRCAPSPWGHCTTLPGLRKAGPLVFEGIRGKVAVPRSR